MLRFGARDAALQVLLTGGYAERRENEALWGVMNVSVWMQRVLLYSPNTAAEKAEEKKFSSLLEQPIEIWKCGNLQLKVEISATPEMYAREGRLLLWICAGKGNVLNNTELSITAVWNYSWNFL